MGLRRGFKSDANWYAKAVRQELGLTPHDPVCPWKLAERLGFEISKISDFIAAEPKAVAYLHSQAGRGEFSAITADFGTRRVIIHNDAHDPKRQSANLAHEIAHGLLIHRFVPLTGASGTRNYDREIEDEASWLGPTLLVSDDAALLIAASIAGGAITLSAASDRYGVSLDLLRMRLNVSGANIRVARRRAA
jgi:hypothetical protein